MYLQVVQCSQRNIKLKFVRRGAPTAQMFDPEASVMAWKHITCCWCCSGGWGSDRDQHQVKHFIFAGVFWCIIKYWTCRTCCESQPKNEITQLNINSLNESELVSLFSLSEPFNLQPPVSQQRVFKGETTVLGASGRFWHYSRTTAYHYGYSFHNNGSAEGCRQSRMEPIKSLLLSSTLLK